jgi:hypothetical protein
VTIVATVLLLLAMPFLLWPLVRPPEEVAPAEAREAPGAPAGREELLRQVEELQLDLASGRIDRPEADRRLAELRAAPG